ncbi:MAG: endonuclease/exonuclease/phosphatase family protein [Kamptonema sp. SIO4C4]|nr:endonuclease/exonuclease/phosphatase family protein [Kamptonema sp. SIO4C4]
MTCRLVSLNLRFDKPDTGDAAWENRREAVAAYLRHSQANIIGTQEGLTHQLQDLDRLLPEYRRVGQDRAGNGTGEYCAIYYHQDWHCIEAGDFWLSDTPEVPGSITPDWGNPLPRMATWGRFQKPRDAESIVLCNTHLDYQSDRARQLSATLIHQRLAALGDSHSYLCLTGDFNCFPDSSARQKFLIPFPNGEQLQDALANWEKAAQMTYHEFTGQPFRAIDTIYYDQRLQLQQVAVDREKWLGVWISDHFPVLVELG